jgi:hypothetical protein
VKRLPDSQVSFVKGALRKLSAGLGRGNYFLYRACCGAGFRPSLARPTDEVLRNGVLGDVLMLAGPDDAACYHT